MLVLIYILISIVLFTSLNLLQRKLAVDSEHPRAMSSAFNLISASLVTVFFLVSNDLRQISLPRSPLPYIVILLAAASYGLFERGRFLAAKLLSASLFAMIVNIATLTSLICSILFLKESATVVKLIGVTCILGSLFLATYTKTSSNISQKGVVVAVFISVLLGFGEVFDKKALTYFAPNIYILFVWTLPVLFIMLPRISLQEVKKEFQRLSWKLVLLSVVNIAGYFFQLQALSVSEASVVFPLVSTSILTTVIIEIFIFKEKEHMYRKVVAAMIALVGVYFLT